MKQEDIQRIAERIVDGFLDWGEGECQLVVSGPGPRRNKSIEYSAWSRKTAVTAIKTILTQELSHDS